jgi:hypothetical protein
LTEAQRKRLAELEKFAEDAYSGMYETRAGAGAYAEAKECFHTAIAYAREVGANADAERLERRLDQVKAIFREQMPRS